MAGWNKRAIKGCDVTTGGSRTGLVTLQANTQVPFWALFLSFTLIGMLGLFAPNVRRSARAFPESLEQSPNGTHVDFIAPKQNISTILPICAIQGAGFASSYVGQQVQTAGVVYADLDQTGAKGFFLGHEDCDASLETSDGIFVSMSTQLDVVRAGDWVAVLGDVREHYGQTELVVDPAHVTVLSANHPLPNPIDLSPPFNNAQSRSYFEAREGMFVALHEARVVGPTDLRGRTWFIRADLGIGRVFSDDPLGTGEIVMVAGDGLFSLSPGVMVGDLIQNLRGPLAFKLGKYQMGLIEAPHLVPENPAVSERPHASNLDSYPREGNPVTVSVVTLNLHNLFDLVDDPTVEDQVPSASVYQRKLTKLAKTIHEVLGEPALIGVQESENGSVLQDLVARPEIEADYGFVWLDGPDGRGLDVALLYRRDKVTLLGYSQLQGCSGLVDGLGPDGNQDVSHPFNAVTCDSDDDGFLDGNRLFSRPPLLVHARLRTAAGLNSSQVSLISSMDLLLLVNHWKSKRQDTAHVQFTLPRRVEQAEFLAALVESFKQTRPGSRLVVLGDLNDDLQSSPLATLTAAGLHNLVNDLERLDRYTYIYEGISQVLDHVLVNPPLLANHIQIELPHVNADFPAIYAEDRFTIHRSSDHDPALVTFRILPNKFYMPLSVQGHPGPRQEELSP